MNLRQEAELEERKAKAKYWKDKHILDDNRTLSKEMAVGIGIDPENFEKIRKEQANEELSPYELGLIDDYLKDPDIFRKITEEELDKKIVGEVEARKVIFLCSAGGRLVQDSQIASYNLLVNDEAGVGKDYVVGAVLDLLPKEIYIHKTRISPAVFTYWHNSTYEPEWTWNGKVFYPEDISEVVLNSDVFKVMCSSGSSATIVIKQRAVEIQIEGKPIIVTTTASATPNSELTRRFVILNLDSSQDQTKAIMKRHAEFKKKGIIPNYNHQIRESLGLLKRVKVKIPFSDLIYKFFPDENVIMRTHFPRFLDFISASAGFHQYQREEKEGYILAEWKDYDIARDCFLKLCSNRYMIPLTLNQKKILEAFEIEPQRAFSVTQFHGTYNFMSVRALMTNFGLLVKYGLLESGVGKDSYGRDMEVYSLSKSYNPNQKIKLPTSEEICRNTTTSKVSKTSIISSTSITSSQNKRDVEDVEHVIPEKRINKPILTLKEAREKGMSFKEWKDLKDGLNEEKGLLDEKTC